MLYVAARDKKNPEKNYHIHTYFAMLQYQAVAWNVLLCIMCGQLGCNILLCTLACADHAVLTSALQCSFSLNAS